MQTHTLKEEWREVTNYEGLYEVSDLGGVRSINRVVLSRKKGVSTMKLKGKILKSSPTGEDGNKYLAVGLSKDSKMKTFRVHKLVAAAFLKPGVGLTVDHIDNDKLNNRADNLQYLTNRDNCIKAFNQKPKRFMTGVSTTKDGRTYKATIMFKGENIMLGYYDNEEAAGKEYLNAKHYIDSMTENNDLAIVQTLKMVSGGSR